jgi:dihydrofolate reductase
MTKVLYSATMSLDGFIAGPGGDMSWLTPFVGGESPAARELMELSGALLIGRTTFGGDDPNAGDPEREGPFGGQWRGPQVVLTHRPAAEPVPGVEFATDLHAALDRAKAGAGDRYVNILGADVARQCLEAGELDELFVFVAPVLLGDGVRLFGREGGRTVPLEPISLRIEEPFVVLRQRVTRSDAPR